MPCAGWFHPPASGDLSRTPSRWRWIMRVWRRRTGLSTGSARRSSCSVTRGLPRDEYFAQLAPRLRRVIDNDASCWHTLDPHTRLMTSDAPAELVERSIFTPETATAAGELLVHREYLVPDSNTFAELAGRRNPVGTLRPGHARPPRAQRSLPRPARAVGHPAVGAPRGVCHPRAGVGCGPSRGARRAAHSRSTTPTLSPASRARSPAAFGHRCASTPLGAAPAPRPRG